MSNRFEPKIGRLTQCLKEGIGGSDSDVARKELGLADSADDKDVARALVQILAACETAIIGRRGDSLRPPEAHAPEEQISITDSSFLGQLSEFEAAELSIARIEDVPTLVAVIRAGSLRQRRAALNRLSAKLKERRSMPAEDVRLAVDTVLQLRDVEVAYELDNARELLPGAGGRKGRSRRDEWNDVVNAASSAIVAFWNGEVFQEPLSHLPGDQRAMLILRARDLPAVIIDHLSCVVDGTDGTSSLQDRISLLTSLRYAGDSRLVPGLLVAFHSGARELVVEAARALSSIDDPRVAPALSRQFERSVLEEERTAIGGALGHLGDLRAAEYVRGLLTNEHPLVLVAALEALESLGNAEDGETLLGFLDHDDPRVFRAALLALARSGDGRVLQEVAERYKTTTTPAARAQIEDAMAAISARMELRGEEAALVDWSEVGQRPSAAERDKLTAIIRGSWDFALGHLWLLFGSLHRAVARFESAAAHRTGWSSPLIAMAMGFARREQHALALPAFRRALAIDRTRIERNPIFARSLAGCFLRRAEQVEREGKQDVARGLLGEALTYDLRWAPSALRFELARLNQSLRRTEERDVSPAS